MQIVALYLCGQDLEEVPSRGDSKSVVLCLYHRHSYLLGPSRNLSPRQVVSERISHKYITSSHKLQEHQSPLADVELPLLEAIIC
jgi:hypothetical protein